MQDADTMPRKSFRVPEIAARNHISIRQVYVELGAGRLEGCKVGSVTLITAEAEARWLANLPKWTGDKGKAA